MKARLRILMVEDSPEDAVLITSLLEQASYEVAGERVETENATTNGAQPDPAAIIARQNRSAGVLALWSNGQHSTGRAGEFGRRLAARIKPPLAASQRDAAETRRRDGGATAACRVAPLCPDCLTKYGFSDTETP